MEEAVSDPDYILYKQFCRFSSAQIYIPEMRLEPVTLHKSDQVKELLEYYMGKNTMERQNFIIDNLVVEEDLAEDDSE